MRNSHVPDGKRVVMGSNRRDTEQSFVAFTNDK